MAKDPFDFSDVFTELENKINNFMSAPETQELLQRYVAKASDKNVYQKYDSPARHKEGGHPYQRRYSLKDIDTYEVTSGRLSMTITSHARGQGFAGEGLTDVIESGSGYEWENSAIYANQPYPRPWMEKGVNDFTDDYLLPTIHDTFFND